MMSCRRIALQTVIVFFFIIRTAISVMGETDTLPRGHIKFTSFVTKKAGALVVTTSNGATHQLNENMARASRAEAVQSGG